MQRTRTTDTGLNRGIHGLRGIAALAVLVAHILGGTAKHIYAGDAAYVATITPFWNLGVFFVYVFFAISGFVIIPSVVRHEPADFAWRRFVRIYPLFLACTVVFIVGNAVGNLQPELNSPLAIVSALSFTNLFTGTEQLTPNGWSLSYEVVFYCFVALAAWALRRRSLMLALLGGAAAVAFLVNFPGAVYFLIGAGVYALHRFAPPMERRTGMVLEACAAVFAGWAVSRNFFAYRPEDVLLPAAQLEIVATALYFVLAVRRDSLTALLLGGRWAQGLGTISYSLYLVHPYVYLPVRTLFAKVGLFDAEPIVAIPLFATVVIAGSIAASILAWRLFEVLPQRLAFPRKPSKVVAGGPEGDDGSRTAIARPLADVPSPAATVGPALHFGPSPSPISNLQRMVQK